MKVANGSGRVKEKEGDEIGTLFYLPTKSGQQSIPKDPVM